MSIKKINISKINLYRFLNLVLCFLLLFSFINRNKTEKYNKTENIDSNYFNTYKEYLFLGDSITNNYTLQKYYPEYPIINSGVGGDKTQDILDNLENRVFKYKFKKVILLVGINDLTHFKDADYVATNIEKITKKIQKKYPKSKIYIESIYPVNYSWKNRYEDTVPNMDTMISNIKKTNEKIQEICNKNGYEYIDVFSILEEDDMLASKYSKDGIHLNDDGYEVVTKLIKSKVFNEENKKIGTQI